MILSVTMNPSVDILYQLETFTLDTTNRVNEAKKTAGGKGLNVARVIKQMGEEVTVTGILGGTIGEFISQEIKHLNIKNEFLNIKKESRNCIAILHEGKQTEILESGPTLSQQEEEQFLAKYKELIKKVKLVTISGSLPKGIEGSLYQKMINLGNEAGVKTLLDCSGKPLEQVLINQDKPYLIKPNETELGQLLNKMVTSDPTQLKEILSEDLFQNIPWIIVSLGANGAFAKVEDRFYQVKIPKVDVINPVGSGDSTIAGLAVAMKEEQPVEAILKTAMTTGLLNAMETETGKINKANYQKYFNEISVEEMV